MKRISVKSSDLTSVGYDPKNSTLEIEFHGGNIYKYSAVPQEIYDDFMNAKSKGSYFYRNIKKAGFSYNKGGE